MLSKPHRIATKEIARIARAGKRIQGEYFDIRCWWDKNDQSSQFAFAVGLKISKSAVVRNRVKRLLRAASQQLIDENKSLRGKYLIIPKNLKILDLKSYQLAEVLRKIIH